MRRLEGMGQRNVGRSAAWLACLLAALALALVVAGPAAAEGVEGGNSFSELANKASQQTETTTKTTSTTSTSETTPSNSRTLIFVAIGAAVLLLSGIAFVIVRDARRVAPATEAELLRAGRGDDPAVRLRKRRAKAKAARQQRKRNR